MKPKILCLETSENYCSVALAEGDNLMLQLVDDSARNHSQILTVLINNLLERLKLTVTSIDAIAISRGPGSYTGLRIGASVAKGLCYATGKPLIAVNTLEILCYASLDEPYYQKNIDKIILCPMIDARRMEVYLQFFDREIKPISVIEAKIIASETFSDYMRDNTLVFFGSGADKIERLYDSMRAIFLRNIRPMASYMVVPAYNAYLENRFENVAYFEPYYLKNFLPTKSRKNLLGTQENKNFF